MGLILCQTGKPSPPEVLQHFFESHLPKSGMLESDRLLLKEKLSDHATYRASSGDGDRTWLARLQRSGNKCFEMLEATCSF